MSLHLWYLRPENNFQGAHSEGLFGTHRGSVTLRSRVKRIENRLDSRARISRSGFRDQGA